MHELLHSSVVSFSSYESERQVKHKLAVVVVEVPSLIAVEVVGQLFLQMPWLVSLEFSSTSTAHQDPKGGWSMQWS